MKNFSYLVVMILAILMTHCVAFANELKKASDIARSSAVVQLKRLKIATENLANLDSTGSTPGADAYRRKIIFVENKYDKNLDTNIVRTQKIDVDNSAFIMKFEPHHPAANSKGYVKYPNITESIERVDITESQHNYEANLAIIQITDSLTQKTIEAIGK